VRIADAAWDQAVALLRQAGAATLVCHVTPDGDALGSMLALSRALRSLGVTTTCTWGDERWEIPTSYRWLPDLDTVVPASQVLTSSPQLLVVLDTASRDRLGVLGTLADTAGALLVIDHHAHNSGLTGIQLVDADAAATAVIVEELVRRLGVALDADTATLLYTGLVTDTGAFQHSVTTPAVHQVAARLLAAGVAPDAVARQLWGSRPFGFLRLLSAALERLQLEPSAAGGRGLVWTYTTRDDLVDAGIGLDEVDAVVDVVRQAREADVAVVCKQDLDGSFRVSTRSRGNSDVGAVCASLGGGGHRLAAGFTSREDVAATMRRLRVALDA
jgi:phosphoesterase RecJ-like protein